MDTQRFEIAVRLIAEPSGFYDNGGMNNDTASTNSNVSKQNPAVANSTPAPSKAELIAQLIAAGLNAEVLERLFAKAGGYFIGVRT